MNDGEIIDCIDESKQPAFDHPLLKNHKIQKPGYSPKDAIHQTNSSSSATQSRKMVNLRRANCPEGTVPIRRTSKDDLIRVKASMESYKPLISIVRPDGTPVEEPPGRHVAALHSRPETDPSLHMEFHGIKAMLMVENLSLGTNNQFSASLLWIESGPPDNASAIQAGWLVSPTLFGDNKTHIFGFWAASGSGCYNIGCAGFVQTNQDYYVGQVVEPASQYDGAQYAMGAYVHQDAGTGNWWFTVYGNINADIGYWPREVVPYLGTGANLISWGGLVYNIPHETSPPMGNGHFPDGDRKKVAVIYDIHYLNENYEIKEPSIHVWNDFSIREDRVDCYSLTRNDFDDEDGYSIFFGGPGGICD
ncbi:hypothetical protein MKW94_000438 [Papaver nudicaule]|uniref:Neprosin PEP catalytic domain-containing protein n=1 Tax=Papaver nudicaule TaxID=74823 RepID=A0AA41SIB0_PAPNU|nr:hypothetical protein [Papaver nudicaule]